MDILKLQGIPVTSMLLFQRYFDPYDLIRQRSLFRDFAWGHLCLSKGKKYHTAMVCALLSDCVRLGDFQSSLSVEKRRDALQRVNGSTYWGNPLGFTEWNVLVDLSEDVSEAERVQTQRLYQWCRDQLPPEDREALFLLLCACYLLAEASDARTPELDAQRLLTAWKSDGTMGQAYHMLSLPQEAGDEICTVPLEAAAYVGVRGCRTLEQGQRIRTFRLDNTASLTDRTLRLDGDIYRIPAGGCRYVNAVGGEIVQVLPDRAVNGSCGIAWEDHQLVVRNGTVRCETGLLDQSGITSFAVGKTRHEVLYIRNYRLYTELCRTEKVLPELRSRRMVEVRFREGDYYLLQDTGRIYSSDDKWNYVRGFTSLNDIC